MISKKAKQMSSRNHIKMSEAIGNEGQRKYYCSCKASGLEVKKASNSDDLKHIDFYVDGKSVDVKGLKETHKDGQILLEIKDVRGGDGWCSTSGPDFIAFDFGAFFLHAKTKDLIKLVQKKCDLSCNVSKIGDALYRSYSRKDRSDQMTIVGLSDVIKSCEHWFLANRDWNFPMEAA